ncbi:MAG: hypothetical protein U9R05_07680 [Chloroflexota bacterium]|nr:hypothetical protein [Chloroflexota bacterium]
MAQYSTQFLPQSQVKQMTELAERGRLSLARFAGVEVEFDIGGLQLLDEWIERHVRQFPQPSPNIMTLWGAFLGEIFRRRFYGEWVVDTSKRKPQLGIFCPKEEHGLLFIDVMAQIQRRVRKGIIESLALYYTEKGIEIKM